MCKTINAIESCMDMAECMTAEEIRLAIMVNECFAMLSEYVLHNWLSTNAEVQKKPQPYWAFRDGIAIIDFIAMKSRGIIVPASLQNLALNQLHLNHMGTEKTYLLACEFIYWVNINTNIEVMIKKLPHMTCFPGNTTQGQNSVTQDNTRP